MGVGVVPEVFSWAEGNALINALGSERWLARRIRHERVARGWSQAGLSELMAASGHPLHQSAISKIEAPPAGEGPRMVTIDEAIGFSKVFDIPLGELLLPPEAGLAADLWRRYRDAVQLREQARAAMAGYEDMLQYQLTVPADSAVPGATDSFLARLKQHRDRLESKEKSSQRALVGNSYYGHYIQNYERPSELLVADDILDAAAHPSEEN
jgi:transcriptional regulator with XRE-family HTH domain